MIVITGAGGFIGSVILGYFNKMGIDDIVLYDDLFDLTQLSNIKNKHYRKLYKPQENKLLTNVECVIHFGANSNTLENRWELIYETNVVSTKQWGNFCKEQNIPMIFASSAAVLGNGNGPLNYYARTKLESEYFLMELMKQGLQCAILRLYNVYGPNEYHKGRMASTIYHWFGQLRKSNSLYIFENSHQYYRDFIYVEDVATIVYELYKQFRSGLYSVGTGNAVSFESVADILISELGGTKFYVTMPNDLRTQYQSYTQADIHSLNFIQNIHVDKFSNINTGIKKYLKFLNTNTYY